MTRSRLALQASLCGALALLGCGSDNPAAPMTAPTPTPPPNYDGTWAATIAEGGGSFTFVVTNNVVTSLRYTFAYSATSGGSSCSVVTTCPSTGACATPDAPAPITGGRFTVSRGTGYSASGAFSSPTTASGTISYSLSSTARLCSVTRSLEWTAAKS